ncbi:MAG: aspartate--tRNA(Asn) ligase, partial [Candidatus Bathyarchaeia archaeon]
GILFLMLQDKNGIVKITLRKDGVQKEILEKIKNLREHSSIGVKGVVKSMEKAPHGSEVIPRAIKVLGIAEHPPPFSLFGGKLPSLDNRLDIRAIDLRRRKAQAIFKIRHEVLKAAREFLIEKDYLEINTPKIIATATEGGAALFPVLYYDKEAFLAQSPQLYKEQLVMAFEKVFEIGPVFRAEESRTLKHLSEIISIDIEEAYVNYKDVMETLEGMISRIFESVSNNCKEELSSLNLDFKKPNLPFRRYTYDEIVDMLKGKGEKIEWGEDLSTSCLKALGELRPEFFFIIDWPTSSKPFYIKPKDESPKLCEAFDLMNASTEVASGGTRISSKELLIKRIREQGLNPESFEYHLRIFDHGMPPHAGFGLGLERLMMVLTNQENIREVTIFPRDQFRLTP